MAIVLQNATGAAATQQPWRAEVPDWDLGSTANSGSTSCAIQVVENRKSQNVFLDKHRTGDHLEPQDGIDVYGIWK